MRWTMCFWDSKVAYQAPCPRRCPVGWGARWWCTSGRPLDAGPSLVTSKVTGGFASCWPRTIAQSRKVRTTHPEADHPRREPRANYRTAGREATPRHIPSEPDAAETVGSRGLRTYMILDARKGDASVYVDGSFVPSCPRGRH